MLQRNKSSNFSLLPEAHIQRSVFDRSSSHKFTFNVGELIPFYVDEVLPGSTHQIRTSKMVRLQTPATPFMDDLYLDTYYFFVPNRLVWDKWKEFQGENNTGSWIPTTDYTVPTITFPQVKINDTETSCLFPIGSIADYMGLPAGNQSGKLSVVDAHEVLDFNPIPYQNNELPYFNALPIRAYCRIVNDWFRDQNLSDPIYLDTGSSNVIGVYDYPGAPISAQVLHNDNVLYRQYLGGRPYQVCKYHDYFTSALPSPLKGTDVKVPVQALTSAFESSILSDSTLQNYYYITRDSSGALVTTTAESPTNLSIVTGLPEQSGISINDLRLAFATQAQYERDARGGTRYTEILRSNFGVISPDASLQRSQYLGGNHFRINVNQVVQQNGGSTDSFLGDVAAFSATADSNGDFIQSFTEHGFIIGVCCARYNHSYQQGAERFWYKNKRFDFYMPAFANIGEQGIKYGEIYVDPSADSATLPSSTFGYQEAWADYRMKPNRVSGEMRSQCVNTLDYWHLADNYASPPFLSDAWIREDPNNVDRVLTVKHTVSNQIFADFYIDNKTTQPIPMYSIPATVGGNF